MRRKVSTLLDEGLFRRVKIESARQGKQISEVLGESLQMYLNRAGARSSGTNVVADSFGVLNLDRDTVRKILSQEEGLLEA